jgi:hypothetical protein
MNFTLHGSLRYVVVSSNNNTLATSDNQMFKYCTMDNQKQASADNRVIDNAKQS